MTQPNKYIYHLLNFYSDCLYLDAVSKETLFILMPYLAVRIAPQLTGE